MMCDLLQDVTNSTIIQSSNNYTEKEIVSQGSSEDEKNKDSVPEVFNKSDTSDKVSKELLEKLASGFLSFYLEDMKRTSCSLHELTRNQSIVIETLQQENTRFSEVLKVHQLNDMFSRVKLYYSKVQLLKKDMLAIHERTAKLKKRAMRLQQQKQKEALQKELQRDRELERDKQLAPKIATKSASEK